MRDKTDLNACSVPPKSSRTHILRCTFSRTGHMLGHRKHLNKFKKTDIISSMLSHHNHKKLKINYRKKTKKLTNAWRLNNVLLNNQRVKEEIKQEIKRHPETNRKGTTTYQTCGTYQSNEMR